MFPLRESKTESERSGVPAAGDVAAPSACAGEATATEKAQPKTSGNRRWTMGNAMLQLQTAGSL